MPTGELLFIYGTLRREGRAHGMMQSAKFRDTAKISGRIVHVDQYPGLLLDSNTMVTGELYWADENLLQELDRYEGCFETPPLYTREEVMATDEDGKTHQAQTYVFQQLAPHHETIEHGDWIKYINQ